MVRIFIINSFLLRQGWNSWNKFACEITEELIKDTADALVSTGLAELGYKYVNLDDCWQAAERDASGMIQADPTRFPSGMTALGEYIHSKGLKFGIYSSAGFKTCQGFPASLGLEETDARAYAAWGVDYLKYDNCYEDHGLPKTRYGEMKKALESSGREIFYSLCEWGRENPAVWAPGIGANSWRISSDIRDEWSSIISRVEIDGSLWRYSGEGLGWNDPDMLEVGNGGCSQAEYRAHFSLWAMLKAPMIIGNDVRTLSTKVMEILGNKEVLAVSQDALGHQARRVWSDTTQHLAKSTHFGDKEVWMTPMSGGSVAVLLLNKSPVERLMTLDGSVVGLSGGKYAMRDLWRGEDLIRSMSADQSEQFLVKSHDAVMLKLTPA
ncbi:glycoside hydrolase superfamily [Ochromonadaceae sp. CCMP2298]|nr:glycoside hydrolase superfamily [Ochromonadaceae sp. CCMP2298]